MTRLCQLAPGCTEPAIARIALTDPEQVTACLGRVGMALIRPMSAAMRSGIPGCLDHVHHAVDLLLLAAQPNGNGQEAGL